MPSSSPLQAVSPRERIDLRRKLLWLTAFRVVATTLMLAAVTLRHLSAGTDEPLSGADQASYAAIAGVYVLTLLYAAFLRREEAAPWLGYVQILGDVVVASALVLLSGGPDSPFTFTYSLAVLAGATLLYGKGAFFAASCSTVAFTVLLLGMRFGWFGGAAKLPLPTLAFVVGTNALAQFLIAALASYLGRLLSTAGGVLVEREHDLAKLAGLQRQILSSMPSGLMTCGADGTVTYVNRAGALILEVDEDESRNLRDLMPHLAWEDPDGRRREVEVPTRSGTKILGLTVTQLDASVGAALIVFQDLTNLRRMEVELRRADQLAALGRMAAQLAHEIKNPLAAMRGSAQMLGGEENESARSRLTQILVREADRLSALVDSFLKFARPPNPSRRSFRIDTLIQECVEMLRNDPIVRGTSTEAALPAASAFADPDQLKQVILNLLRNAYQAVGALKGVVRIKVRAESRQVSFEVWDSAGAIAEEHQRRLFEPFFTTRAGGTGLGLSVSHSIVQANGGSIRVRSAPSEGTTFTVTLPASPEVDVADSGRR